MLFLFKIEIPNSMYEFFFFSSRLNVISEIYQTEKNYVKSLRMMIEVTTSKQALFNIPKTNVYQNIQDKKHIE